MQRRAVIVTLLIAGVAAGALMYFRSGRTPEQLDARWPKAAERIAPPARATDSLATREIAQLEQRMAALRAELTAEAAERQRLESRLDALAAQLATAPAARDQASAASGGRGSSPSGTPANDASRQVAAEAGDDGATALERALLAAGIDPTTAADIKRRRDDLTLAEIYLRDQATREQWLDSPRFRQEMEDIDRQRTSIRDEIGDDRYDRYLAALGEPNRVRIAEVLAASPAADAGLQPGDLVLRYGDTRIFAPDDLVSETRSGTAGEAVHVEVFRNGQRITVDVPRGPLGLRIAASQANPDES